MGSKRRCNRQRTPSCLEPRVRWDHGYRVGIRVSTLVMKSLKKNLVGQFPSKGPSSNRSAAAHPLIPAHFPQTILHTNLFLWCLMYRSSRGASRLTLTRQSRRRTRATAQVDLALHHRPQTTQNLARLVPVPTYSISSILRTQIRPRPRPLLVGPLLLAAPAWDPTRRTEDTEIRREHLLLLSSSAQRCHRIPSRMEGSTS